jgi:hypothetical protein
LGRDDRLHRRGGGLIPCDGLTDLFFAEDVTSIEAARAICHTCELRARCLARALKRKEPWGVWGGFSTRERNAILGIDPENPEPLFQVVSRGV